jgi:ethanolamine ammonia-lyase small subunit
MNEVGELLSPNVVVLLIGERPGLATAESLSAYLGYRPRKGHTDADRNLISNIHAAGVSIPEAVNRIAALVARLTESRSSGCLVKESVPVLALPGSA